MVFVFTFLGEFGYELLNWQGRIRKFAGTLAPSDSIVCCSRANVYSLYEMADQYIDISEAPLFRRSRATCYSGTVGIGSPARRLNRAFDALLRASLRRVIGKRLRPPGRGSRRTAADQDWTFVFSSNETVLHGVTFGCDPARLEIDASIFEELDVGANLYTRLEPDLRLRGEIEQRVGFDLAEPYVLMQTRARRVGPQSKAVPKEALIRALSERARVVLLSFETGRALDSVSRFDSSLPCIHYAARSFPEQACLVAFARHCVFFTEGDFGSHIYVPPFMGKDVVVIAPSSVYGLGTTPIDFYHRNVFRFGGQIVPRISEEVFASARSVRTVVEDITCARKSSGRHL